MAKEMLGVVGAVILGRRTFDVGLKPWGDTPYPVPCFVLTHRPRAPLAMKSGTFTFVADGIVSALDQARVAAGGKDIIVMGANAAQQYLKAGLCDEMLLQLALVLLGAGTRLFDHLGGHDRADADAADWLAVRHAHEVRLSQKGQLAPP